jgi:ABC-type glycerol-3-phosphate transport system substrate-binding protein
MTRLQRATRRQTIQLAAASAVLPLVHIRTAGAAGKLALAFWDHWVPGGNDAMTKQINAWAEKNKVVRQQNLWVVIGSGSFPSV